MATKKEELEMLARREGALANAADDEEIFILVAHDRVAADTVLDWIERARQAGVKIGKIMRARQTAERMAMWQSRNRERVKVPD